jgi:hypothetical protein
MKPGASSSFRYAIWLASASGGQISLSAASPSALLDGLSVAEVTPATSSSRL